MVKGYLKSNCESPIVWVIFLDVRFFNGVARRSVLIERPLMSEGIVNVTA